MGKVPVLSQEELEATGRKLLAEHSMKPFDKADKIILATTALDSSQGIPRTVDGFPDLQNLVKKTRADDITTLVGDVFNDHDKKRAAMELLGRAHCQQLIVAAYLITSAWMVSMTPEENKKRDKSKAPSEYDTRMEVQILSGTSIDKQHVVYAQELVRNKFHQILEVKPLERLAKIMQNPLLDHFWQGYADEMRQRRKGMKRDA